MIGIYKITGPSGKVYIGQTWNSKKRFSNYKNLYCKCQTKLCNSLRKYGPENHMIEMIHELPSDITQDIMDSYEALYMDQYRECKVELMNLRGPGSRGKHTEESKAKMREVWNRPIKLQEEKTRIGESLKEYYRINGPQNTKVIYQCDLEGNILREWNSGREAAKSLSISHKGISAVASCKNGRYKTYKGFIWRIK